MPNSLPRVFLLFSLALLAGCVQPPKYRVHYTLIEGQRELPASNDKVLLMPLDIKVQELSAGGLLEIVPDRTERARGNMRASLAKVLANSFGSARLVAMPELDDEERELLDQHLALNQTVLADALILTGPLKGGIGWRHKIRHFDYTLGPGLAFLADRTGADKALFVVGQNVQSSSGRKATFFALAMLTGVGIQMGYAATFVDLVDLKTGDVLWSNYFITQGLGYTQPADTDRVLEALFKDYPGLEDYRKYLASKSD